MQNYYGMAIRQNTNDLYSMKKAVGAVLYHCSYIPDENIWHQFCPKTADTCCKWQADKLNGTTTYKQKINLPPDIKELLLPIFKDLSADSLLSKCLHGQTQNQNEALNGVKWKKCPKDVFVCRTVLEIAVFSAVIDFNEGSESLTNVTEALGIRSGTFMESSFEDKDALQLKMKNIKSSEKGKQRRKKLRAIRKGFQDKEREEEGGEAYA